MSAPAGTYNIVSDQGATFFRQLTWKDSAGVPVDLDGYTARMQLRSRIDAAGSAVLELTTGNSRIVLGGTAGTIDLAVSAATMESVEADTYVYDLELVSGSVVTRLVQGTFEVRGEVTR